MQKSIHSPSRGDVHVNRPLTNMSVAFMQSADNFVASRVFANINSGFQSDLYYSYPRGEFNRIMMKTRAPGTESAGASYKVETKSFLATIQALHRDIPDPIRANQDNPINLDTEAMSFLSLQALLRKEKDWANDFFKTAVWTYEADGAAARSVSFSFSSSTANDLVYWNNASSTPIEDIDLAVRTVQETPDSGQMFLCWVARSMTP